MSAQLLAAAAPVDIAAVRRSARITAVADLLERAVRDGADVGDLLAAACRETASRLATSAEGLFLDGDGTAALVAGRPCSWEAQHVRALANGWESGR